MQGLAGVMYQKDDEGQPMIIAVTSRSLKGPELNYSATEIEGLAVVWVLKKWAHYLIGQEFKVVTDHKALTFLQHCCPAVDRLRRWILFLQQFNFSIEYIEGKDNNLADYLSRTFPIDNASMFTAKKALIMSTIICKDLKDEMKLLSKYQQEDEQCVKMMKKGNKYFTIFNDIIFVMEKESSYIYLPNKLIVLILKYFHDDYGHYGHVKTAKLIKKIFPVSKIKINGKNVC